MFKKLLTVLVLAGLLSAQQGGQLGSGTTPQNSTFWSSPAGNTPSGATFTQNVASAWGIQIDKNLQGVTRIRYNVGTLDNTANNYNLALYSATGGKVLECGATAGTTFAPSAGIRSCIVTAVNVPIGLYFVVMTTDCAATCAALQGTTAQWVYVSNSNVGATVAAALPASITPPASSYTQVNTAPSIQLN